MNNRTSMAQREDRIRRTVYVSDIDQHVRIQCVFTFRPFSFLYMDEILNATAHLTIFYFFVTQITEEHLALLFINCGHVCFAVTYLYFI